MASYEILRSVGSDVTYNLNKLSETTILMTAAPAKNAKGTSTSATFTVQEGDPLHESEITVTIRDDDTGFGGAGSRNCSVNFASWLKYTDDDGVVNYAPVNSFIGFNLAQSVPCEAADILQLLEANLGFIVGTVTEGEPALTRITRLIFGVAGIF